MLSIAETAEFIGRQKELDELNALLNLAGKGKGQIIFISGEAGIGKTRLINEVRSRQPGQSFNWLTASCIHYEGTDPYLPFNDALKDWVGSMDQENLAVKTLREAAVTEENVLAAELAKIPVIGNRLAEDPQMPFGAYMIKEPKADRSLAAFSALIDRGNNGLCITRIPTEKLGNLTGREGTKVFWLTKKGGEGCIPPSLTKISHEITSFIKSRPNTVIMLDGLEYIMGNVEFDKMLRFVNEIVDSTALHKCILIIPINPSTIDKKQMALIERDMTSIDLMNGELPDGNQVFNDTTAAGSKLNEEVLKQGRERIFEAITQQILDIASTKPVALFIDDLHWADAGALHLLHYLARAVKNQPVAIIGSYRPEDLIDPIKPHPFQTLLNRMSSEKLVKIVTLERFDEQETGMLIESLLTSSKFPKKLIQFIYKETEGNAFFIEELIRSLEEESVIYYDEKLESWTLSRDIKDIATPDSIKDVVNARTDRLDKSMRIALESASVLGLEFEYDILSTVSALHEHLLVTHLDDLVRLQLIKELPTSIGQPVRYRFAHNKICEVLYEGLGQSRKRLLHTKAVEAMEDKYQNDLDPVLYELAEHCYYGGDYRRCLRYAIRAGEKAIMGFAPEKATTFYKWALDSTELMGAEPSEGLSLKMQKTEVMVKLTELETLIGEWDQALKYSKALLELSEKLEDDMKRADAYTYAGLIHMYRSAWKEAIEHFKKGLSIAEESNYQSGQMESYYGLGSVHERMGEHLQAMEYYQNFMELAVKMESPNEIARGYRSIATISSQHGEYKAAMRYYKKCTELLSETENYSELAKAYAGIGVTYCELSEFDKVIESNEKCIELAERSGNIRVKGYGYSNAAEAYARKNQLDKAMEYTNRALEIFTRLDEKPMIALAWMNYGIINKQKKVWDTARKYFERSRALLKNLNVPYYLADCNRQLGLLLAEQGTPDSIVEGRRYLQEALKIYKKLGAVKYIDVVTTELEELIS
ncbi:MAG: DUF835 domain-containing protein [Thermoplasmata archaeon]|nr:MAG: DUF835 domain-containing protein [Thermoplasmata archaeon]